MYFYPGRYKLLVIASNATQPQAITRQTTDNQNSGMAEMVTYLPISSPFIRFAGRYVDEAFGVAAGYNFFIFEGKLLLTGL